jgi:hypothetical protein
MVDIKNPWEFIAGASIKVEASRKKYAAVSHGQGSHKRCRIRAADRFCLGIVVLLFFYKS